MTNTFTKLLYTSMLFFAFNNLHASDSDLKEPPRKKSKTSTVKSSKNITNQSPKKSKSILLPVDLLDIVCSYIENGESYRVCKKWYKISLKYRKFFFDLQKLYEEEEAKLQSIQDPQERAQQAKENVMKVIKRVGNAGRVWLYNIDRLDGVYSLRPDSLALEAESDLNTSNETICLDQIRARERVYINNLPIKIFSSESNHPSFKVLHIFFDDDSKLKEAGINIVNPLDFSNLTEIRSFSLTGLSYAKPKLPKSIEALELEGAFDCNSDVFDCKLYPELIHLTLIDPMMTTLKGSKEITYLKIKRGLNPEKCKLKNPNFEQFVNLSQLTLNRYKPEPPCTFPSSLEDLILKRFEFSYLEHLFKNSINLETLTIEYCEGESTLTLPSSLHIEELIVKECEDLRCIVVANPSQVNYLEVKNCLQLNKIILANNPDLENPDKPVFDTEVFYDLCPADISLTGVSAALAALYQAFCASQ